MTLTPIRQFFASPVFAEDEAKTLNAHIMNNMIVVTLFVTLVSIFVAFITAREKAVALVASLLFWGVQWLAFFAVQKGYVKAAAISYVMLTWLGITLLIAISGGMLSVVSILYVGIIVLAALVISKRVAVGLTILTSITVLIIGLMAEYNILQPPMLSITELTAWFVFPNGLIATLVPINAALNRLQAALDQSQQLLHEQHKIQSALRDSETRFSAIFNQALDGIAHLDDNVITMVNPAFADVLGYTEEELVGQHITEFVIPRDRELVLERTAARIHGEAIPDIYEITMLKGDSSEFPVEVSTGAIRYDDRVTIVAIIRGMSVRKQAQENIQRLNVELQAQTAYLTVLNQISQAVSTLTDLESVLRNTLEQFQSILSLDVFFVILHDESQPMINYPIMYDSGKFWETSPVPALLDEHSYTAQVIRERKPLLVNSNPEAIKSIQYPNTMVGDTTQVSASILMAPLTVGERIIGTISIQSYTLNAYDENHLSLLQGAAYQIAIAVENARLYEELRKELAERKQAEEQVRRLNAELEKRVLERTKQLQAANDEMAAFTYSVSHDLRAPLRALNGFATIVAEELGDNATESIQHYLQRIQYNARRMGNLIDDLLALSRVGRAELHVTTIDMQQLARQVIDEMQHDTQPDRVTFMVGDLPPCQGDRGLLKQVWVNLIDNAVKYSQKVAQPIIKIYAADDNGKPVYIIKDNGSGFDMQYVDKLFGVFQRLHSAQEYEGTGVGLATTQRIIARHGGVIWAESELGNGATFYFSIGKPQ